MDKELDSVGFYAFTVVVGSVVLVVIVCLCRWISRQIFPAVNEERRPDLTPLPSWLVEVTTSCFLPDMITFDSSSFAKRAVMMCGHVISPESMENYAWNVISKGNVDIVCPYPGCDMIWPNWIVKHVACLSMKKMKEFDLQISENSMARNPAFQKCPKCFKWIRRHDPSNNRVHCSNWSKAHWFRFTFCWVCLREWKRFRSGKDCGNPDCNDLQKKIKILSECPEKVVCSQMCPSVRGCPNCGTLIEFIDHCNQMQCIGCKHYFCFICISHTSPELDGTICRSYSTTCQVAERQTSLPIR